MFKIILPFQNMEVYNFLHFIVDIYRTRACVDKSFQIDAVLYRKRDRTLSRSCKSYIAKLLREQRLQQRKHSNVGAETRSPSTCTCTIKS